MPTLNRPSVAVVSMPFGPTRRPSLQLGLLKALGRKAGHNVESFHLALDFAKIVGLDVYSRLATMMRHDLIGDWLFSELAFPGALPASSHRYLDTHDVDVSEIGLSRAELARLRTDEVPAYVAHLSHNVDWATFDVVGFTTTFQQTAASVALARVLKERWPRIVVIFGGGNCEGVMGEELARSIECVDYVFTGEADLSFPKFLDCLSVGDDPLKLVPGVVGRRDGRVFQAPLPSLPVDLGTSPAPDYDEYFARAEAIGVLSEGQRSLVEIPFESARGCWWGEKAHCTFCGLNGGTMAFRAKNAAAVAMELRELSKRYRTVKLYAVDNIVSRDYVESLFVDLARDGIDYELFYEVKSSLTREDLGRMRRGGVTACQPGIESLSTEVLKLMKKGVTALQNVNFLRWARYYGFDVTWLMLWGFPGERSDWYDAQARLIPLLAHLQPPSGWGRIRMERFSPMFRDAAVTTRRMAPMRSYEMVYPGNVALEQLAYFFEYEFVDALDDDAFLENRMALKKWRDRYGDTDRPTLLYWSTHDSVVLEDRRQPTSVVRFCLEGPAATVFRSASQRPVSIESVGKTTGLSDRLVDRVVNSLAGEGLIAKDGDRFLALALPATPHR